ncbi:DUF6069 family protein [Streptomyces sp. NPDC102467]|uniref:DUF6069 family protein n=1 Tax=Streptomyces sp. NPDC102467 TaxID=3366179 RepID=UPI0037F25D7E
METPDGPYGRPVPPHHDPSYTAATYYSSDSARPAPTSRVDAGRLWAGGAVTALVAALTAAVALLFVRGILGIPVFAPEGDGAMGNATTGVLAGGAAVAALAATALLHVLIVLTPQPGRFFTWIVALATAIMVLLPFTTSADLWAKIATAAVYLVIGAAIGSLLSAVGRSAYRRG